MQSLVEKIQKWPPPARWLLYFIASVLLLAFLFAPEAKPVNYLNPEFAVSADDRLFFQNMRSYYYHQDARSRSPMIIYRSKRRRAELDSVSLQFALVQHPHRDEAYAIVEPGEAYKQYPALVVLYDSFPADTIQLLDREGHYKIAAKVYSSLIKEEAIFLASEADTLRELYQDKRSELSALSTLEDYFKLINKN